MEKSTFSGISEKLASVGSRIALSGMGNPFSNGRWSEYIELYKKHEGKIGLVVNVASLEDAVVSTLCLVRPNFMEVSFPSLRRESFAALWPTQDYDLCMEKAMLLIKRSHGLFPITVVGLKTAMNGDEEKSFKEFWKAQGVSSRVFACHGRGGNLRVPGLITAKHIPGRDCGLFSIHSFITWEGKVLACCHDLSGETLIGDLRVEPLEEIAHRKIKLTETGLNFKICVVCDEIRKGYPVPAGLFPETPDQKIKFLRSWSKKVSK